MLQIKRNNKLEMTSRTAELGGRTDVLFCFFFRCDVGLVRVDVHPDGCAFPPSRRARGSRDGVGLICLIRVKRP